MPGTYWYGTSASTVDTPQYTFSEWLATTTIPQWTDDMYVTITNKVVFKEKPKKIQYDDKEII